MNSSYNNNPLSPSYYAETSEPPNTPATNMSVGSPLSPRGLSILSMRNRTLSAPNTPAANIFNHHDNDVMNMNIDPSAGIKQQPLGGFTAGLSARLGKRKSPIPLKITIDQPNNTEPTHNPNKSLITATPTSTPLDINNSSFYKHHSTRTPINTPLPRDDEDTIANISASNYHNNISILKPARSVSSGFNDLLSSPVSQSSSSAGIYAGN
jgi:hypothetical protein